MEEKNQAEPPQRYVWPWFVLGAVVLGIVLAVFWMGVLVHRVHEQRESDRWPDAKQVVPVPQTNSSAPNAPH